MPKGPVLTSEVTGLIGIIHREHPDWKSPRVQMEVQYLLREDAQKRKQPPPPDNWPGQSVVQKVLSTIRNNEKRLLDSPLGKPWNLDALSDNAVPPEILPKLFAVWFYMQENPYSPPLTIREARWVTQLSSMTDSVELLYAVATTCAQFELIGELTGTPQLSSPHRVLFIYSLLARMSEEEYEKHSQAIYKEEHVTESLRQQTIELLRELCGSDFATVMKKEMENERKHKAKKQE